MIAVAKPLPPASGWQHVFLSMLPVVRRQAWRASRQMPYARRHDFVAEVVANVAVAVAQLANRGELDRAFPSSLVCYAVRQVRSGRRVGGKLNVLDVTSAYCGLKKGVRIVRFDDLAHTSIEWKDSLLEDRRAGPAETAAARLDTAAWLRSLSLRNRRIAKTLATGESTLTTARKFGITAGRVSQLRRELEASWLEFHGEVTAGRELSAAA